MEISYMETAYQIEFTCIPNFGDEIERTGRVM
jgi:hypothetical protein